MKNHSSVTTWLLAGLLLFISSNSIAQLTSKINPELEKQFASSLNTPTNCEAYPYLTDDGLRLYFTTDRKGGFGMLYYCSRNSVNENFGEPRPLSKNLADGFYAATFTGDELTIYASKEGDIYTAKRNSLNDEFKKPVIVKGLAEGRKFAPSISPDGNELIVLLDISNGDVAVHYRRNEAGDFVEVNRMKGPGKTELDPGQFSKDGLSFYASYEVKYIDKNVRQVDIDRKVQQKIVRFTRGSLADNFKTFEEIPDELNFQMRNHQPTMNKDETIFVVVNSEEDLWGKNELRLVNLEKELIVEDSVVEIHKCALEEEVIEKEVCKLVCGESKFRVDTAFEIYPYIQLKDCRFDFEIISEDQLILADTNINIDEPPTSRSTSIPDIISQIKVYPNPFKNIIVITLEKNDINSNFELFDISGRKIMTSRLNNLVNRIQLNKPGAGIYIYRLLNSQGKVFATGRLVRNN